MIDEVGCLSYSNRHADLLFELISQRYQHKSTVVTTNKPFAECGEVLPNAACAVSLIDRLMHRTEVVRIDGESYRQKEADKRDAARKVERAAHKTSSRAHKAAPWSNIRGSDGIVHDARPLVARAVAGRVRGRAGRPLGDLGRLRANDSRGLAGQVRPAQRAARVRSRPAILICIFSVDDPAVEPCDLHVQLHLVVGVAETAAQPLRSLVGQPQPFATDRYREGATAEHCQLATAARRRGSQRELN